MPHFFFDTHNGDWAHDNVGIECVDIKSAREAAKRTLAEMASSTVPLGSDYQSVTVVVRNHRRQPVYTASLSFVGLMVES
ncbi:DUF6894 family protein [Methylobacterium terricola]|uniref:DUF6894 family protein n=1 Tax=Methylobacterium terricola TaxID=2583531 RepID=UPI0026C50A20